MSVPIRVRQLYKQLYDVVAPQSAPLTADDFNGVGPLFYPSVDSVGAAFTAAAAKCPLKYEDYLEYVGEVQKETDRKHDDIIWCFVGNFLDYHCLKGQPEVDLKVARAEVDLNMRGVRSAADLTAEWKKQTDGNTVDRAVLVGFVKEMGKSLSLTEILKSFVPRKTPASPKRGPPAAAEAPPPAAPEAQEAPPAAEPAPTPEPAAAPAPPDNAAATPTATPPPAAAAPPPPPPPPSAPTPAPPAPPPVAAPPPATPAPVAPSSVLPQPASAPAPSTEAPAAPAAAPPAPTTVPPPPPAAQNASPPASPTVVAPPPPPPQPQPTPVAQPPAIQTQHSLDASMLQPSNTTQPQTPPTQQPSQPQQAMPAPQQPQRMTYSGSSPTPSPTDPPPDSAFVGAADAGMMHSVAGQQLNSSFAHQQPGSGITPDMWRQIADDSSMRRKGDVRANTKTTATNTSGPPPLPKQFVELLDDLEDQRRQLRSSLQEEINALAENEEAIRLLTNRLDTLRAQQASFPSVYTSDTDHLCKSMDTWLTKAQREKLALKEEIDALERAEKVKAMRERRSSPLRQRSPWSPPRPTPVPGPVPAPARTFAGAEFGVSATHAPTMHTHSYDEPPVRPDSFGVVSSVDASPLRAADYARRFLQEQSVRRGADATASTHVLNASNPYSHHRFHQQYPAATPSQHQVRQAKTPFTPLF